jgi:hypothetical protein
MEIEKKVLNKSSDKKRLKSANRTAFSRDKNKYIEAFGKVVMENTLNNEIKLKMQEFLEKLNDNDSKSTGYNELKIIISKYNTPDYIKVYFPLLTTAYNNSKISARELQILLIGYTFSQCSDSKLFLNPKLISSIIDSLINFLKVT